MNMGVTAAQYGNGGTTNKIPQGTGSQLSGLQGGNPELKPEQADTYTIGVNFAPSQIHNFSGSIDYYHIAIKDEITTIPSAVIFSQCANTADPFYCSQVFRNPFTGGLTSVGTAAQGGYVVQTNINAGAALVSGVDLQLNYRHDLPEGWGKLGYELNGTYLQHVETTPVPGVPTYDCAGLFGLTCQTVNPRWRHIFRATWTAPGNVTVAATWRYMSAVGQDNNSSDPSLRLATFGGLDLVSPRIASYSYLDLAASWHFRETLTLRAGINNVLDKDPPLLNVSIVPGGEANTIDVYDMFGRQLFLAFSAKF
jgi:outer membrane receptor protein involved in Fe transport